MQVWIAFSQVKWGLQDHGVNPIQEENVTFRIVTNVRARKTAEATGWVAAIHAGRRAVQVCIITVHVTEAAMSSLSSGQLIQADSNACIPTNRYFITQQVAIQYGRIQIILHS